MPLPPKEELLQAVESELLAKLEESRKVLENSFNEVIQELKNELDRVKEDLLKDLR